MPQKPIVPSGTTRTTKSDQPVLFINGKPADQATIKRVMNAKPVEIDNSVRCNQVRPFSILR